MKMFVLSHLVCLYLTIINTLGHLKGLNMDVMQDLDDEDAAQRQLSAEILGTM